MATATLAATLNTPMSELQPAKWIGFWLSRTMMPCRKVLRRLFSSEGYEVDVVPDGVAV